MGGSDFKQYGFPETGMVCDTLHFGECVVDSVDGHMIVIAAKTRGDCVDHGSWGYAIWPKGTVPSPQPARCDPDVAWGRKGPLAPPMVGMVIEVEYLVEPGAGRYLPRNFFDKPLTITAVRRDLGVDVYSEGYDFGSQLQGDEWGKRGMRIVKLPDDFTWPVKDNVQRDIAAVATKEAPVVYSTRIRTVIDNPYIVGLAAPIVCGPCPSDIKARVKALDALNGGMLTIQNSGVAAKALPSLFLTIGDCKVEFRRDGAMLVNDRPVGNDRETCELFAEFARCQTQGTVGEISFDRAKILATLSENARLRERLGVLEQHCRTLEGALTDGGKR